VALEIKHAIDSHKQGGYNLDSTASSALAVTRVLLGEAPPELPPMVASEEATETIWQVAMQQSKYWKSIHPKAVEPREGVLFAL
jgi:histone deacetylase 6